MSNTQTHGRQIRQLKPSEIKTVEDLRDYLWGQPSPIAAELINGAIRFFEAECKTPDEKPDWKEIKKRRDLGLGFRLTPAHVLTDDIIRSLRQWMSHMNYGRDIGTDFFSALMSHSVGGGSTPREDAFLLLSKIQYRLFRESPATPSQNWEFGTVDRFVTDGGRNYGFLALESGETIFFQFWKWFKVSHGHYEPVLVDRIVNVKGQEWRVPKRGDRIRFIRKETEKGPKAKQWCFEADWQAAEQAITEQFKD